MSSFTSTLSLLDHPFGSPRSRTRSTIRQSFDAAARSTPFATHCPFDPAEELFGFQDGGAARATSDHPLALEPACKEDATGWSVGEGAAEARRLLSLAVPLVFQSLASMLLTLISTVFVGRLNDPVALSGVVLASSVYNVTGVSMCVRGVGWLRGVCVWGGC